MIESILYKTAIYCRLSLDDGSLGESGSIQTQKMMLEKYCKDNNYTIKEIYIDDGVSDLTFDREGFKRMLKDIELSKINMVITKDLSRKVKLTNKSDYLIVITFSFI
jgi:DNA invertase Pin-like site-specific DNA recombinase